MSTSSEDFADECKDSNDVLREHSQWRQEHEKLVSTMDQVILLKDHRITELENLNKELKEALSSCTNQGQKLLKANYELRNQLKELRNRR